MIPSLSPSSDPSPRPGSLRPRLTAAAIALVCLGGLALSVDLDVARWCKAGHIPKEIMRFLNFSEVFAHGIGVATLLLTACSIPRSAAAGRCRGLAACQ